MGTITETSVRDEIFRTHKVVGRDGVSISLHSHTSLDQGLFLQRFVERDNVSTALEIGLAYGVSSLFICECLAKKKQPRFISIDNAQSSEWGDIGLANLGRAGFDHFTEFHAGMSRDILPKLLASGCKIDFAYVDTSKVFDVVLMDACYLSELLNVGGFLAFDDCGFPGIRRAVRYLAKWPHLKVAGSHGGARSGFKRRAFSAAAQAVPFGRKLFRDDLLQLDDALGVNANCVVFQKIGEDHRRWDWSVVP